MSSLALRIGSGISGGNAVFNRQTRTRTDLTTARENPTFLASDLTSFAQASNTLAGRGNQTITPPSATAGATLQNIRGTSVAPIVGRAEGQSRVDQLASIIAARRADISRQRRQPGRSQTVLSQTRRSVLGG